MARSTKADKARQLNAAHHLLQRGIRLPEAVRRLSREFDLSGRQAYRYLEQATHLDRPVEVSEVTVPITLKLRRERRVFFGRMREAVHRMLFPQHQLQELFADSICILYNC